MAGIMSFLARPEFAMWLSGVGRGLTQASQPGGQFDMSQTNALLMQRAMQEKQREELAGVMEQWNLTPEQRSYAEYAAQYHPQGLMQVLGQQMFPKEKSYLYQQQVQDLMRVNPGMTEQQAINHVLSRYRISRDPITGVADPVDMFGVSGYGGAAPSAQPPRPTDVLPPEAGGPVSPPQAQPAGSGQGFGVTESAAPPEADFTDALGLEGMAKGAVNWLSDIAGQGLVFENADKVATTLNNLQVRTQTMLQDAVPGRPSNYLMQKIEGLTVTPNSIRQGPSGALNTLKETRSVLQEGIRENEEIMSSRVDPKTASQARAANVRLKTLLDDYSSVISALEQNIGGRGGVESEPLPPPSPGMVVDGYRFKGGDPNDPNAWEQVQ